MKIKFLFLFFILLRASCKLKTNSDYPEHSYVKYMVNGYLIYSMQDTTDTGKITKCVLMSGSLSCVVIGEVN